MLYPLSYEGEGCANHGAKCAARPRSWDLEASGPLFGVSLDPLGRDGARRCAPMWWGGALFRLGVGSEPVRPLVGGVCPRRRCGACRTSGSCPRRCVGGVRLAP